MVYFHLVNLIESFVDHTMDDLEILDDLESVRDNDDFKSMVENDWRDHVPQSVFIALSKFEITEMRSIKGNRKTEAHVKKVVHKLPQSYTSSKVNFNNLSNHQKSVVVKFGEQLQIIRGKKFLNFHGLSFRASRKMTINDDHVRVYMLQPS